MRRILFMLLLLVMFAVPAASAEETALLVGNESGLSPTIPLYLGPSVYSEAAAYCYPGTQPAVLDQGSGLTQIAIGPLTGWISNEHLLQSGAWSDADVLPLPGGQIMIPGAQRYRYLYDQPNGQPIASLEQHVAVSVAAVTADNAWLLVLLPDGAAGYLPIEAVSPADSPAHAYVTGSDPSLRLHLRTEPTTKCDSLGNYYCGTEIALLFSSHAPDGWTHVAVCGKRGWMKTEFLSFSDHIGSWLPPLGVVQGTDESGLNLREFPDYSAPIITRYVPGTTVEMLAVYGVWAHVRTQDGHVGYMLLKHLGGDQPAAVPNRMVVDDRVLCLLSSRPVCAWQYTASEAVFSLPETCAVSDAATGAVATVSPSVLPAWHIAPAAAFPAP